MVDHFFSRRLRLLLRREDESAIIAFTAMDGSAGVIREINDSDLPDFNHPLAGRTVHF